MKPSAIFLLITLDEIAIGIALIPLIHYLTDSDWWIYGIIIAGLATVLAIKFYIFYPQYKKPRTGKEGMIRLRGKVVEPLNPEGQVKIRGKI